MKKTSEFIQISPKLSVFEDKKSHARTVAFPFDFPTGEHGVIMITRLAPFPWNPAESMKSITINFTDHEN